MRTKTYNDVWTYISDTIGIPLQCHKLFCIDKRHLDRDYLIDNKEAVDNDVSKATEIVTEKRSNEIYTAPTPYGS